MRKPADADAMHARRAPDAGGKVRLKTLRALDGRTIAAKRAAALAETFAAELGQLTPAQRVRVETAAALSAISEDAQTRRLAGDDSITLDDLVRAVSAARRAVRDLGIKSGNAEPAPVPLRDRLAAEAAVAEAADEPEDEQRPDDGEGHLTDEAAA
jgi:hypothetical protein